MPGTSGEVGVQGSEGHQCGWGGALSWGVDLTSGQMSLSHVASYNTQGAWQPESSPSFTLPHPPRGVPL